MTQSPQDQAVAFWLKAPGQAELRTVPLAPLRTGEVEVETLYSGISRGTEALVFRGAVPQTEWQRMRAPFQDGEFPAPVKYGYLNVGRVVDVADDRSDQDVLAKAGADGAGPANAADVPVALSGDKTEPGEKDEPADEPKGAANGQALLGQPVFCLYPHQTRYRVPRTAVHPLPTTVPPARAVLAAQMETAVNALWDAEPCLGDRIAVVGAGTIGCLCAWLAGRMPGCEVELIDTNRARAPLAQALGVAFALPEQARREADLVLHASGTSAGLTTALALAGVEARIVELSWFGTQSVQIPLGEAFHARRLSLRASQVGQLAMRQRLRWDHRRRLGLALSLLAAPELDQLITGEDHFSDLPRVMARLAKRPGDTLMHRIRYD